MKLASYHAKLVLGSYRADQANDPEIYVTAVATLLASYHPSVGARLTDPKTGIAGHCKFLPSIAEIKEAADELISPGRGYQVVYSEANTASQFSLRDHMARLDTEEPAEVRAAAVKRIMADYERQTGLGPRPRRPLSAYSDDQLRSIYGREQPKPEAAE